MGLRGGHGRVSWARRRVRWSTWRALTSGPPEAGRRGARVALASPSPRRRCGRANAGRRTIAPPVASRARSGTGCAVSRAPEGGWPGADRPAGTAGRPDLGAVAQRRSTSAKPARRASRSRHLRGRAGSRRSSMNTLDRDGIVNRPARLPRAAPGRQWRGPARRVESGGHGVGRRMPAAPRRRRAGRRPTAPRRRCG